jgi:hypothetical protein
MPALIQPKESARPNTSLRGCWRNPLGRTRANVDECQHNLPVNVYFGDRRLKKRDGPFREEWIANGTLSATPRMICFWTLKRLDLASPGMETWSSSRTSTRARVLGGTFGRATIRFCLPEQIWRLISGVVVELRPGTTSSFGKRRRATVATKSGNMTARQE